MKKYFNTNHIDAIELEELTDILHHADMHPEKYIRIVMDEDFSCLDIRGDEEEILRAIVFVEDRLGNFSRYNFNPEDPERRLYMAIDPEKFIAISLGDPENPVDGIGEFKHKEAILGIFKTAESTVMIIYKDDQEKIECRYYPNSSVFDIMTKAD